MKRAFIALGFVALALMGYTALSPATGQDRTDERLTALETQVADLDQRLTAVEQPGETTAAAPASTGGDAQTLTGAGSVVSDDVQLDAIRYEVTVTYTDGNFIVAYLHGEGGYKELLVSYSDLGKLGGTVSTIVEISTPGIYFVGVELTQSPWTITFEPR